MERSTVKAAVLASVLIVAVAVGLALTGFMLFANLLDPFRAAEEIDAAPLNEVVTGLDVLRSPTNHCPESANQCWASVVVSSGQERNDTATIIAQNADRAGFVEVEGFDGRWTAERGSWCLNTYQPNELQIYDAGQFPSDALYVALDSC